MGTSAKLSLRVDLSPPDAGRVGPGKIALLEAIRDHRSISAAARQLDMSYRRAWMLLDALNQSFKTPVVTTATGGKRGGGAELSPAGEQIIGTTGNLRKPRKLPLPRISRRCSSWWGASNAVRAAGMRQGYLLSIGRPSLSPLWPSGFRVSGCFARSPRGPRERRLAASFSAA